MCTFGTEEKKGGQDTSGPRVLICNQGSRFNFLFQCDIKKDRKTKSFYFIYSKYPSHYQQNETKLLPVMGFKPATLQSKNIIL